MWKKILSVTFALFILSPYYSYANDLELRGSVNYVEKVVFFVGTEKNTNVWDNKILGILDRASSTFPMEIEIYQTSLVRAEIIENVRHRIDNGTPFDYAIVTNLRGTAVDIIKLLDVNGVKTILFNTDLSKDDRVRVGFPRQDVKNWIGEVLPQDELASINLTTKVIEQSLKSKSKFDKIRIFALSGTTKNQASRSRVNGLRKAASQYNNVEIIQITPGRWRRVISRQKVLGMYQRYGTPDIIWCANDEMALGAVDAIKTLGLEKDEIFVIGFDWSPEVFRNIENGNIEATAGGHYLDLFFVLALIDRHARNLDFIYERNGVSLKTDLTILDSSNVEKFSSVQFTNLVSEKHIDLIVKSAGRADFSAGLLLSVIK